jgi:hypothetical protein
MADRPPTSDLAVGIVVAAGRAGTAGARLAVLPVAIASRAPVVGPRLRGVAGTLAGDGRRATAQARELLEALVGDALAAPEVERAIDRALAGPLTDAVARSLVDALADEIVVMARRAFRDLEVAEADVVLGGGMLHGGKGLLYETVAERLPAALRAVPVVDQPVVGAVLAALDEARATDAAKARLREELRGR